MIYFDLCDLRQEEFRARSWSVVTFDTPRATEFIVVDAEPEDIEEGEPLEDGQQACYRIRLSPVAIGSRWQRTNVTGLRGAVESKNADEARWSQSARKRVTRQPEQGDDGRFDASRSERDPVETIARLEEARQRESDTIDVSVWPRKDERRFYERFRRQSRTRPVQPRATPSSEPGMCPITVLVIHDATEHTDTHPNRNLTLTSK